MRSKTRRKLASLPLAILSSLLLSGCWPAGTRIILQRPGTAVTLTKAVKGATVMAHDKDGKPVIGKADLPAGTICGVPKE